MTIDYTAAAREAQIYRCRACGCQYPILPYFRAAVAHGPNRDCTSRDWELVSSPQDSVNAHGAQGDPATAPMVRETSVDGTHCNQHPDHSCACPASIRRAPRIVQPRERVVTVWDTSVDVPLESPRFPGEIR